MCKLFLSGGLFFLTAVGSLFADGGTVQLSREEGPFRITVFSTSAILRAGPEDISVLVQDRATHQPLLDAAVRLFFHRRIEADSRAQSEQTGSSSSWVPPCCRMKSSSPLEEGLEATHEMATNKLLYATTVILPDTGQWEVRAEVKTKSRPGAKVSITGELRVEPPAPPALAYWPFFCLPVVSIAGYMLHFYLSQKRRRRGENLSGKFVFPVKIV